VTLSNTPLQATVLRFLDSRAKALGVGGPVSPQTLVFEAGLLDSLALMDLVAAVEQSLGQRVDMLRFDPSVVESAAELVDALSDALSAPTGGR
jgi:acyl carrier protein